MHVPVKSSTTGFPDPPYLKRLWLAGSSRGADRKQTLTQTQPYNVTECELTAGPIHSQFDLEKTDTSLVKSLGFGIYFRKT